MLKKPIFILLIVALLVNLLTLQAAARSGRPTAEHLEKAESFIAEQFKEAGIVGGSYAIVYQDQLLAADGVGYSDKETKTKATEETVYASASITKSLTATAIYLLQEQGKLSLDDPVQKHIPWFTYAHKQLSKQVTIRHLLTQSAGISRYDADGSIFKDEKKNRNSIENAVRALNTVPMNALPGEKGQYCNTCYNTLGLIIETVSGMSYYDYMDQFIFKPLNMKQTAYGADLENLSAAIAKEYSYFFGFETDRLLNHTTFGQSQDPEGGIYTNAADLAKFASASLGYGKTELLPAESQRSMFEGQVLSEQAPWRYTTGAYAAGEIAGEKVVYKGGDGIGSASGLWLLPEKEMGIILIAGEATSSIFDIGSGVINVLIGEEPKPISYSVSFFQMIGYAMTVVTAGSILLIAGLAFAVFRRIKKRSKLVKRRVLLGSLALMLLIAASVLTYILFMARLTQAGFYGFPADMAAGLISLITAFLVWAAYGFYLSLFGRPTPQTIEKL